MSNTKYLVKINQKRVDTADLGYMFFKTTCAYLFCGILVNTNNANFYFEVGDDKDLVIIPHSWIEWMAPKKPSKEETQQW